MIFGGKRGSSRHAVAVVRDVVEVTAIVIAGFWAFYVFAYENRIKPSMADPDVNVSASMQRLSERNGFIAVSLHLELHNVGTVRAHFLGMAINVYGQRITPARPQVPKNPGLAYDFQGFYRAGPLVPVYTWAYVTSLGNPATGTDSFLDPGSTIANDRTFYVPQGQFALLTLGIDAPYTKYENATIPTHLEVRGGAAKVVAHSPNVDRYSIEPVTSLDVR